jgi:Putative Ig domain
MNYFDLYSTYPDHTIAAAWDTQVKEAAQTPGLAEIFLPRGSELFPRFAACYAELRALPRGARRALQRRIARSGELATILPEYLHHGERRLQRRMAWSLAGAALLLALGQGVATAATITVTTNDPSVISDGQCSLIEAIVNANNDAATHADCVAGSGADTIVLPANANVTLTNVYDNQYGLTGLPRITSRITIEGNGAVIARQGSAPAFGLMAVSNSGDLTLQSVTLSGGSSSEGGGVSNRGALTIDESTISGNTARGVFNYAGTLIIENSTISNNTSGGLFNAGNTSIINSTISGNTANSGGGVFNFYGILTIENSTISGNTANVGGGVYNSFYFSDGNLILNRSLIAGNQATVASEIQNRSIVTANNFNLFGTNGHAGVVGFTPGPTDIVPARGVQVADILGPLENNGGPTQTHALVSSSPAINAGNLGGCVDSAGALLTTDQRGFPRPFNGTICDIGSYELQADPLTVGVTAVATGEAGVSFTSDLMIFGGVAPYIVSITKGALPAGLSLGNDGVISGAISPAAKSAKITVRITDSFNGSVSKTFTITVLKALNVSAKAKTGRVGKDYAASLKIKGGLGPFNWSITAGVLPTGLSFNSATGALTGTPTESGTFPLTVQVTDALGGVDAESLTLTVK